MLVECTANDFELRCPLCGRPVPVSHKGYREREVTLSLDNKESRLYILQCTSSHLVFVVTETGDYSYQQRLFVWYDDLKELFPTLKPDFYYRNLEDKLIWLTQNIKRKY